MYNLEHVRQIREHQEFKIRVVTSNAKTDLENFLQLERI